MTRKLIDACKRASALSQRHHNAIEEAVAIFKEVFGVEPDEDCAFMNWIHYGEIQEDVETMNEAQG